MNGKITMLVALVSATACVAVGEQAGPESGQAVSCGGTAEWIPPCAAPETGRRLFESVTSPASVPLLFRYADREHVGLGAAANVTTTEGNGLRGARMRCVRCPVDSCLEVRVEASYDPAWGEVEYVVYFRNPGTERSRELRDVYCLNRHFPGERPVLRGIMGDHGEHYSPYEDDLLKRDRHFCNNLGRATHYSFPYFDLAHGTGGTLMALGWAGTWEALFGADDDGAFVKANASREIRLNLLPGEEIRTARVVLLPYAGRDEFGAANLWRAWFRARNMPRANAAGDPVRPFGTAAFAGDTGLPNSDGSISERSTTWQRTLRKLVDERMTMDFRWFDAGWYCDPAGKSVFSDWWGTVGCWQIDAEKWPGRTLHESNDACRNVGMRAFCWFEPERVTHVDELVKNWGYRREWAVPSPWGAENVFNNIGDPACRAWTLGRILKVMDEGGFDLYREDNNSNPEPCWRVLDQNEGKRLGCTRLGMAENRAICGHYAMWDAILGYCAKHGKCTFLDSCASGGGRNDIESLRRSIPFLRSDADRAQLPLRISMTTTFCRWIPFHGASVKETENELETSSGAGASVYAARVSYLPIYHFQESYSQNRNLDWNLARRNYAEWKSLNHLLVRDFYPLTPWHYETRDDYWAAFAYDAPDLGESVLLVFRQPRARAERFTAKLPFAVADAAYEVVDADVPGVRRCCGTDLRNGLDVYLPEPKTSKLYRIRRTDRPGQSPKVYLSHDVRR